MEDESPTTTSHHRDSTATNVIVVGGGFAGALTAKYLQDHFNVTLVDPKDHFECTPSFPFVLRDSYGGASQLRSSYSSFLSRTRLVRACADQVKPNGVVQCSSGETLSGDYIVMATGSSYDPPFPVHARTRCLVVDCATSDGYVAAKESLSDAIKTPKVVVVGGGPTGVEVAAEIAKEYPCSSICLVHSGSTLLDRSSKQASSQVLEFFKGCRNVRVALNQRVVEVDKSAVKLSNGERVRCNVVFIAAGSRPRTTYASPKHFKDALMPSGYIAVQRSMQVVGHRNIFAIGDIAGIDEEKLAQSGQKHAKICATNIRRLARAKGGGDVKLKEYKPSKRVWLLSLGPHRCISLYGSRVLTNDSIVGPRMKSAAEWKMMKDYR